MVFAGSEGLWKYDDIEFGVPFCIEGLLKGLGPGKERILDVVKVRREPADGASSCTRCDRPVKRAVFDRCGSN